MQFVTRHVVPPQRCSFHTLDLCKSNFPISFADRHMVMDMPSAALVYYFCIYPIGSHDNSRPENSRDGRREGPRSPLVSALSDVASPHSIGRTSLFHLFHVHTTEHPTSLRFLSIAGMQ